MTHISTSPEKLWNALLDPKMTAQYRQHENLSDWKPGSSLKSLLEVGRPLPKLW